MQYRKLSLLLVISLVLLLVISLGLICIWFYFYFYHKDVEVKAGLSTKDSIALAYIRSDSVRQKLSGNTSRFDSSFQLIASNRDSLKADFDNRLTEFYGLRNEITALLKLSNSKESLEIARQKISELQEKINELRNRTTKVESENKKLTAILQELNNQLKGPGQDPPKPINTAAFKGEASKHPRGFAVSNLQLSVVAIENGADVPTNEADQAEKLNGNFTLKNKQAESSPVEIFVVVLQPDGRVMQNSSWETGRFESVEGKKIYSSKFLYDENRVEPKRFAFSITGEEFQKGDYVVQVYCKGVMTASATKTLY